VILYWSLPVRSKRKGQTQKKKRRGDQKEKNARTVLSRSKFQAKKEVKILLVQCPQGTQLM
jgi:hypothetical protein